MIEPVKTKIVVKRLEFAHETAGGIYIPEVARETTGEGRIEAVGPGTDEVPMDLRPGQRVIFQSYAGYDMEVDGEKVTIMDRKDIMAVLP